MSSPTQRSLAALRADGWLAEVVEKWIPGANIRKDLFGFIDIVAIRDTETVGVQTTSASNLSARVKKMGESPLIGAIRKAGWKLEAHGWRKVKGRWACKKVDVS